jgi:hypothetical protein
VTGACVWAAAGSAVRAETASATAAQDRYEDDIQARGGTLERVGYIIGFVVKDGLTKRILLRIVISTSVFGQWIAFAAGCVALEKLRK